MSKLTRRAFLETTLVTAAAGLATAHLWRDASAAELGAEPKSTKTAPNDRIGVAIIGLHGRGLSHVDAYSYDESVDVVALCDIDESTFGPAQKKLQERGRPAATQYQDLRKLFENKDVHAVSIATPNHWHALAALWAMQAGKDVYCEKPVCHNISEGRRLVEAQVKYDRICAAGTQWRSSRFVREAMQFIHDGKLGDVKLSRALCYKRRESIGHFEDSAVPGGVNYDIWQGPAPSRPFNKNRFHYNWHWNWAYGNGDIGNQGIHEMDKARWALNQPGLPTNALSLGGRFGYVDDGQTPNTQLALFDYGGPQLLFEVRGLKTPLMNGIDVGNIIYGTEGMIVIGNNGTAVQMDKDGKVAQKFKGGDLNHFSNFIAAVRSRKQSDLRAPILEGHISSSLCHLANTSYRLGSPQPMDEVQKAISEKVDLAEAFKRFEEHLEKNSLKLKDLSAQFGPTLAFDPKAENYGNNQAANAFLTREYRAPFVVPATLS